MPMKLLLTLLLLTATAVGAATSSLVGSVRVNTDTTGTNTIGATGVVVTNLNGGAARSALMVRDIQVTNSLKLLNLTASTPAFIGPDKTLTNGPAGSAPALSFDTIADMTNAVVTVVTAGVQVNRYSTVVDDNVGGGQFYYDSTSGATPDGGTVFPPAVGTGRYIRQLNGQPLTPYMFGARGNASANDLLAIQAATDAAQGAAGGVVAFPNGTFNISGTLTPYTGLTFLGSGGKIVQTASNTPIFKVDSTSASNLKWDGMWLRGTGDYVEDIYRGEVGIYITNVAPTSTNITIQNCVFENFGASAVFAWGADSLSLLHNKVWGTGTATYSQNYNFGFYLPVSVLHLRVEDNEVAFTGTGMDGAFTGNQEIIANNFFHDMTGQHAIYATDAIGGMISGNIISNVPMVGIKFQLATGGRNGYASAIKDNILINVGEHGVLFLNADPSNGFVWTNVTISGNIIMGTNAISPLASATNAGSIYCRSVSQANISDNQIFNRHRGIEVYDTTDVVLDNNSIKQVYGWGFYGTRNTNIVLRNTTMAEINHTWAAQFGGGGTNAITVDGLTVYRSPNTTYALDFDTDVNGDNVRVRRVTSSLGVRFEGATTILEYDENLTGTVTGLPAVTFIGRVGCVNTGSVPSGGGQGDLTWARAPSLFAGWINNSSTWLPFGLINDPTLLAWDATNYSLAIGRSTLGYSFPLAIEHDTNDIVTVLVKNGSTASLSAAGVSYVSGNSSGFIGAYPLLGTFPSRLAIVANSDANGIELVTQQAGQTVRLTDPDLVSVMLRTDGSGDLRSVAFSGGLSFDGTTLSTTFTNYVGLQLGNPNSALTTGNTNFWIVPEASTLVVVTAHVFVTSSSGSVTLELKKNGTTVLSAPVSITAGSTNATASISVSALAANDRLAGEVTAAGTTAYGAYLNIGVTTP